MGTGAASGAGGSGSGGQGPTQPFWVNLYYPGWTQDRLPPSEIDYEPVTQIIHFAWLPVVDSNDVLSLDEKSNGVGPAAAAAAIEAGHAAGKTVTIAVGGAGRGSDHFPAAISDRHRANFIEMIVGRALERGYDGIDIDMEIIGLSDADGVNFRKFSRELRDYMTDNAPAMTLTCATLGIQALLYGQLDDVYDQINIMTYDLVYGVGQSWFDAPLYGDDGVYSVDRAVREYKNASIPYARLGVGFKFGGFVFQGVAEPRQPWSGTPSIVRYTTVMNDWFSEDVYRWDDAAEVPFLSIASGTETFITYEDPDSIAKKVAYAKEKGLGGLILWDASDGYFPERPAGERHPLLTALQDALSE